jgi:2-hydroxy-3-keto-5-methylthiopentenyl-1-phosphate phosphatase
VRPAAGVARAAGPRWRVLCDFDGTVSTVDVTDSLLLSFARPGWAALEAAWQAGRIGSRACMAGQVALLDCSREELEAHVAGIAIDPAFKDFVQATAASGASFTVVSDGLDEVIVAILGRAGLPHLSVRASRLVQTGPRRWALEFPHARKECRSASATCKCFFAGADPAQAVLMIGDGVSDFCVAETSDLTFARSNLLGHCIDADLAHRPVRNFSEALLAWRELMSPAAERSPAFDGETVDERE